MPTETPRIQTVSDTAYWVASYRAVESQRRDALFRDPLAERLTGDYGRQVARSMRRVGRYAYWTVILRTCIIDDLIQRYARRGCATIINLGAGLDTRPYRLSLPPGIEWIEVDLPEVVDWKREQLGDQRPSCPLERIGLDLADEAARREVFDDLDGRSSPALVLTEGVIPYLDEPSVARLAEDLHARPGFRFWLTEYYSPKLYPRYRSSGFRRLLGGSPFRFFPADWFAFFAARGWHEKESRFLYDEGKTRNRPFPLPFWATLLQRLVGEERMKREVREYSAYVVLEKQDAAGDARPSRR